MPILGGSPLGLIGVDAQPTRDGMSTFNAGKSRNVKVLDYNIGKGKTSLFTGGTRINPWPNIKLVGRNSTSDPNRDNESGIKNELTGQQAKDKEGKPVVDSEGNPVKEVKTPGITIYEPYGRNDLHNNAVYDTSLLNIIEKLSFSNGAALRPTDFAYLKDLGVYPNNRLVIARKFLHPVGDDLNKIKTKPKAVLICWKKQDEDFLDIDFGEEWTDADADFTNVLNKMGEDFMGKGAGNKIGAALNAIPLPGFTETIQRVVLEKIGVYSPGASNDDLPAGNPNLIKKAKRRATGGTGQPFSGLTFDISVKMTCEYEQKFISGIDPTVAFIDIIHNILSFGTQDSSTYGLSAAFGAKLIKWVSQPSTMINDFVGALTEAFKEIKSQVVQKVKELTDSLNQQISDLKKTTEGEKPAEGEEPEEEGPNAKAQEDLNNQQNALKDNSGILQGFLDLITKSLSQTVRKYREELRGIVFALSGAPSTPYHVTVGNPLRPIFCSGDMYTTTVKLTLGPTLTFNDLPSSIKADFTLKPARPRGLQEIMAKFNTGNLRVVNLRRDQNQTDNPLSEPKVSGTASYMYVQSDDIAPTKNTSSGNSANSQNTNNQNQSTPKTTENGEQVQTNKDGSSSQITK